MVGITIGMVILVATTWIGGSQLLDQRNLVQQAQLQQELRLIAETISRDITRAGYWGRATMAVWPDAAALASATDNPYAAMEPSQGASTGITYSRSTDEDGDQPVESEDGVIDGIEQSAFVYNADDKTIEMRLSNGRFQALTDPSVIVVTAFDVDIEVVALPVPCGTGCVASGPDGAQLLQCLRTAAITIEAHLASDPAVTRSTTVNARLRNDLLAEEACP